MLQLGIAFPAALLKPGLAAGGGFAVAAAVGVGFKHERRHGLGAAFGVERHVGQVGRTGMAGFAGDGVFALHAHAHFHGGRAHEVDAGQEGDDLADIGGL